MCFDPVEGAATAAAMMRAGDVRTTEVEDRKLFSNQSTLNDILQAVLTLK